MVCCFKNILFPPTFSLCIFPPCLFSPHIHSNPLTYFIVSAGEVEIGTCVCRHAWLGILCRIREAGECKYLGWDTNPPIIYRGRAGMLYGRTEEQRFLSPSVSLSLCLSVSLCLPVVLVWLRGTMVLQFRWPLLLDKSVLKCHFHGHHFGLKSAYLSVAFVITISVTRIQM